MKSFSTALFLTALVAGASIDDNNPNWSFLSFGGGKKIKTEATPSTLDAGKPSNLRVETNLPTQDSSKPSQLKSEVGRPIPKVTKPNDASVTKPNDQNGNNPSDMIPEVIQPISNPTAGFKENGVKENPIVPDTKRGTNQEDRKEGFLGRSRKRNHRKTGRGNRRHRDRDDYDDEEDDRHHRSEPGHGHRGGRHLNQEIKPDDRTQQDLKQGLTVGSGKVEGDSHPPPPHQLDEEDGDNYSDDDIRTFNNDDSCEDDDDDNRRHGHHSSHSPSCRRRRHSPSRFD